MTTAPDMVQRHPSRLTTDHPRPSRRPLVVAITLLAAGLATNALLGPLATGLIEYHYGTSMTNQGIGLDAVALAVAAPLALAAAALVVRGRPAGPVLALAPAAFAAYMMPQYVVGPDYLGLPGNNERAIPFHLALFVLAAGILIGAWRAIDEGSLPADSDRSRRRRAWVLFAVAAFTLFGRWLPSLPDALSGTPTSAAYRDNPTAFWLVAFLDLGVVVPAAIAAGVGLRRRATWARTAGYAVIGWFSLVPASVASMAITMQVRNDPLATTGNTVTMTVAGVVLTGAAALLYRPLLRTTPAVRPSRPTGLAEDSRRRSPAARPDAASRTASRGDLTIELEEVATRSVWAAVLGLFAGMMQQWHFVGLVGEEVRYESETFAAPYSWGHLPLGRTMLPREEWAPGMGEALERLRAEIRADGWVVVEHGEQAWQERYELPGSPPGAVEG